MKTTLPRTRVRLPDHVLDLFWEYPKNKLSWNTDTDLIVRKILESGGWDSIKWLITTTGYSWLKNWIIQRQGAGLDSKRLRFWQIALNLSQVQVDKWVAENNSNPWYARTNR